MIIIGKVVQTELLLGNSNNFVVYAQGTIFVFRQPDVNSTICFAVGICAAAFSGQHLKAPHINKPAVFVATMILLFLTSSTARLARDSDRIGGGG